MAFSRGWFSGVPARSDWLIQSYMKRYGWRLILDAGAKQACMSVKYHCLCRLFTKPDQTHQNQISFWLENGREHASAHSPTQ